MVQVIPINSSLPAQTVETVLAGSVFRLTFVWNTRTQQWHMTIRTRDEVDLLTGLPVVLNYELLDRFADERLPAGYLVAYDSTQRLAGIGRFDLGAAVRLLFIPRVMVSP